MPRPATRTENNGYRAGEAQKATITHTQTTRSGRDRASHPPRLSRIALFSAALGNAESTRRSAAIAFKLLSFKLSSSQEFELW